MLWVVVGADCRSCFLLAFALVDRGAHAGGHGEFGGCTLSSVVSSTPGLVQGESCDGGGEDDSSLLMGEGCSVPPSGVSGVCEDDEGGYPFVFASFASFPGKASASVMSGTLFCG